MSLRTFSITRAALALGGAATLLLGSVGISAAQQSPTSTFTSTSTSTPTSTAATPTAPVTRARAVIDDAAAKLGLTGDQLAQALRQARHDLGVGTGVGFSRAQALGSAAKALGLADAKALRQQLKGTTLSAVANQHGVDPATVASAIKAELNAQVDAQVSAGKLNATRAATLKQRISTRVDALMTHQFKAAATTTS